MACSNPYCRDVQVCTVCGKDEIRRHAGNQLAESRRLTDKMNATRAEWDAGKGKNYSTALDFIISQNRRRVIVAELRGMFRLLPGGKQ